MQYCSYLGCPLSKVVPEGWAVTAQASETTLGITLFLRQKKEKKVAYK